MACKYVKDFTFDSSSGYTGSSGKTQVKAYMRGGSVRKAPLDAAVPKQTPTNMRPLRTANAKTAMKEGNEKNVSGASGKIKTAGQYAKGGNAKPSCACGGGVEMKKGGKAAKKSAAKKTAARRSEKQSDAAAEQVLMQMLAQASQTGTMPGIPMQAPPMPAPNARAVPSASQSPMLPMRSGGDAKAKHAMVSAMSESRKKRA